MLRRTIAFVLVCLVLMGGSALAAAPNDPGWGAQWHLRTIHADRAWAKSKGSGIVVAVVDTGVDLNHIDLQGRLVRGADLVDNDGDPMDEQGHGTFMAGLIAARTGNGEGVASVAPLAKIMPIRALKSDTGDSGTVAKGIDYAASHGARIINLSLAVEPTSGSGVPGLIPVSASMRTSIDNAAKKGILVAIAAGNNFGGGTSKTAYDSSSGNVLVVGASTKNDRRAAYSNYGAGLDVLAPGGGTSGDPSASACSESVAVISTWWKATDNDVYGSGCGSSMAVAHVSGVAALLMARGMSASQAVARIKSTAVDLYSAGRDDQSGWGRVDAAAAVGATATSVGSANAKSKTSTRSRAVAAAGTKPTVKGTKVVKPSPAHSPIRPLALESTGPFGERTDTKPRFVALALALAVGGALSNTIARRRFAAAS
jgi:subtilisin family serine protease